MPGRTIRRTLFAVAAVIATFVFVVARAGGEAGVQSAVPELTPTQSLPQAPSVPTPSVPAVPSAPDVPSAPAAPSTPNVPSAPSAPEVKTPSTPNVPGTGSVADRGGSAGGAGSSSAGSSGGSDGVTKSPELRKAQAQDRRVARKRRAAREAKLRRDVARLAGCLGELDALDASVLALRAGLGSGRAQSRQATARRLGISTKRTAKVERRGLRGLRRAARGGACATGVGATPGLVPSGSMGTSQPAVAFGASPSLRTTAQLRSRSRDEREAGGVKGATASSADESGATPGEEPPVIRQAADTADDGAATGWYVLLALVLAFGAALLLLDRRARLYRQHAPIALPPAAIGSATPTKAAPAGPEAVAGPAIAAAAMTPEVEAAPADAEPAAPATSPEPSAPDLMSSLESPPPGPPPAPEADMRAAALWPALHREREGRADSAAETKPAAPTPTPSTAAEAIAAQASADITPEPARARETDRRRTATVVAGSLVTLAARALVRRRRRRR